MWIWVVFHFILKDKEYNKSSSWKMNDILKYYSEVEPVQHRNYRVVPHLYNSSILEP